VIALSKQYRIATPYTSFLVLESEAAYDQQGIDRKGNRVPARRRPTATRPPAALEAVPEHDLAATREEPAVFFPEAKASDHNESRTTRLPKEERGLRRSFLGGRRALEAARPGKNPGVYDIDGPRVGGRRRRPCSAALRRSREPGRRGGGTAGRERKRP
jgi:hypothetical protein